MKKELLKDYFSFTKKERNAVIILLLLIAAVFLLPSILPTPATKNIPADTIIQKQLSQLPYKKDTSYYRRKYEKGYYHYSKPDTSYHSYFRQNENRAYSSSFKKYTAPPMEIVSINKADTSQLLPLPGIGAKLAARILTFRDKLGGFYTVDQIAETYGLPDSTFQKIKPWLKVSEGEIMLINLNTDSIDRLKQHPYVKWTLANAIMAYRKQHGNFKSVEELKEIAAITPEIFKKIAPYLKVE